ncbi:hypothetical protein C5167_037376 [Papaver somniferum]|uniref:Phytosulfokine n=1 Tax=Papaver somniferum TaxID=3469 RepID=A0A4Y7I677_PAPSO|nr:phytosulfokines-like [Papaver somniferum]RZC44427.1 hypothetical protein C5167_037376 [Papaver somniferum]
MSKIASVSVIILVIFFVSLAHAARPEPTVLPNNSLAESQQDVEVDDDLEFSCNGVGEEECLRRKTLMAHVDYIYTQKKHT